MGLRVMSQVGVGLIGCGGRLRDLVGLMCRNCPEVRFNAIYDPSPESIAAAKGECDFTHEPDVCQSTDELLSRDDVQWVMIGSRNCDHPGNVIDAIAAGKHVFCEKPLATNLDDCLAMRDAIRASDRHFVIGFTLRFSPFYRKLHELVAGGALGDLVSFEFNETLDWHHGGFIHGNWRRHRELAGTHLLEKCCHDIDVAGWLVGSLPVRVASFGGLAVFTEANRHLADRIGPSPDGKPPYQAWRAATDPFTDDKSIVDHQVAIIEYANGVKATFHTNCNTAIKERRMYLCGTTGSIRGDVIHGLIETQAIGWNTERQSIDPKASGGHGGGDPVLTRELADCMRHGNPPAVGLDEGLASAITSFAIDDAMDCGQIIDLRPTWRKLGMMD